MTIADLQGYYRDPSYVGSNGAPISYSPSSYEFNTRNVGSQPVTTDQQLLAANYRQSELARQIATDQALQRARANIALLTPASVNPYSGSNPAVDALVAADVNARNRGFSLGVQQDKANRTAYLQNLKNSASLRSNALGQARLRQQSQNQQMQRATQLANERRQEQKDTAGLLLRKRSQDLRATVEAQRLKATQNLRADRSLSANYKEAAAQVVGGMDPQAAADAFGITDPAHISRLNAYRDYWQAAEDKANQAAQAAADYANAQRAGFQAPKTTTPKPGIWQWLTGTTPENVTTPLSDSQQRQNLRSQAQIDKSLLPYASRVVRNPDGSYSLRTGPSDSSSQEPIDYSTTLDQYFGDQSASPSPAPSSPYGGVSRLQFDDATGLPIVRTASDLATIPTGREFLDAQGRRGRKTRPNAPASPVYAPPPNPNQMSLSDLTSPNGISGGYYGPEGDYLSNPASDMYGSDPVYGGDSSGDQTDYGYYDENAQ